MQTADKRRRAAFTLIELLVVITILLILLGIIIPALGTARESSRRTSCRSNLQQIGLAFHSYAGDRDGWFPLKNGGAPAYSPDGSLGGEYPFSQHARLLWTAGYLRSAKVWVCPSDKIEGDPPTRTVSAYQGANFAGGGGFNSFGNCSYMYIAGYGEKFRFPTLPLDVTKFAVLLDEANPREEGNRTPGNMPTIGPDDNHGANYRNVLYADGHVTALQGPDVANAAIFPEQEADQYKKVNSID